MKRKAYRSSNAPPPSKKRKRQPAIEEITYDAAAREEYLSGFQKRKKARIKLAKEKAEKRERDERVQARKAMKEERKKELTNWLEGINPALGQADGASSEEEADLKQQLDYLDEDEDRHARVTVEEMQVSADDIRRALGHDEDDEQAARQNANGAIEVTGLSEAKDKSRTKTHKEREGQRKPKKKRKKFRYESKSERKTERDRQKKVKKQQAEKRKAS